MASFKVKVDLQQDGSFLANHRFQRWLLLTPKMIHKKKN
jgi:hypothetical protein